MTTWGCDMMGMGLGEAVYLASGQAYMYTVYLTGR